MPFKKREWSSGAAGVSCSTVDGCTTLVGPWGTSGWGDWLSKMMSWWCRNVERREWLVFAFAARMSVLSSSDLPSPLSMLLET